MISPVVAATECIPSRKAKASTGAHLEYEGNHQGQGGRAADAGKQTDDKSQEHADHHQAESLPLQNQKEAVDESFHLLLNQAGYIGHNLELTEKFSSAEHSLSEAESFRAGSHENWIT